MLHLNTSESFVHSHGMVDIGDKYNINNKTICGFCYNALVMNYLKCFKMSGKELLKRHFLILFKLRCKQVFQTLKYNI